MLETEYWPKLYERTRTQQEPPEAAFGPLRGVLPSVRTRTETERWLHEELEIPAETTDTHPSLSDRLSALGVEATELVRTDGDRASETAAERYLVRARDELLARVDREWREAVGPVWREQWAEAEKARARLRDLAQSAEQGGLEPDELGEWARLTEEFEGAEQALPLYEQVLARTPGGAPADFAVGRILLARGKERGLEHLERAMRSDPDAVLPGCEIAYGYLRERGRTDDAERYRERAEHHAQLLEAAGEERQDISVDDELAPHDLGKLQRFRARVPEPT